MAAMPFLCIDLTIGLLLVNKGTSGFTLNILLIIIIIIIYSNFLSEKTLMSLVPLE